MAEGLTLSFVLLRAAEPIRTRDQATSASFWFHEAWTLCVGTGRIRFTLSGQPGGADTKLSMDAIGRVVWQNHVSVSGRGFFPRNFTDFQIQILPKQLRRNSHDQFHLRAAGSASPDRKCARPRVSLLPSAGSDWLCLVNNSGVKSIKGETFRRVTFIPPSPSDGKQMRV